MTIEVRKPSEEEMKEAAAWPLWTKEPSEFPWFYEEKETCLILKGAAYVAIGSDRFNFGAGDWVVFPAGLKCVWTITEDLEKKYKFGD